MQIQDQTKDEGVSGEPLHLTNLSPNGASREILKRLDQGHAVTLTAAEGRQLAATVELAERATRVARSAVEKIIKTPIGHDPTK